ncbi:MAG TPA: DUF4142 domain-containing protein [Stenotrophomonas sp.]|jgi:predicted outer membrane protein
MRIVTARSKAACTQLPHRSPPRAAATGAWWVCSLLLAACNGPAASPSEPLPADAAKAQQRQEAAVDANDRAASRHAQADSQAAATREGAPGWPPATDRERAVLGRVSVEDRFQEDVARLALDRDIDGRVLEYARTQQRDHAAQRGELDRWLPDTGNRQAQAQLQDAQRTLAALRDADPAAFQDAYIETMVSSHLQAIAWLEETIPAARTPGVRAQLEQAHGEAERHLQAARRLPGAASQPHQAGANP